MHFSSETVENLVEQFMQLPTIGRKTAQRLASYVLKMQESEVRNLAEALLAVKANVVFCTTCQNVADEDPCRICTSPKRDHTIVAVVEEPTDVIAIERTHEYRGVYHVLGGVISPLDGIGPEDIRIRELIERVANGASNGVQVSEIILAVNPNVEGDTTSYSISQLLKPFDVRVTRLARGIPIGSDLEFADEATLTTALEGRESV